MAIITQTVHLTTKTNNIPQIVRAVQNDSGRDIKMILDDLTVTSGMTGELTFKRSDGTFYGVTATPNTSDSSFTAQMDQALTQPGKTYCQLKVTDTDVVSTFSFVIYVEADQSGTVTPQEGIDLVSAVQAAEDAADRAESAASTFETDTSLSVSGMAADAKIVGDEITRINSDLSEIDATISEENSSLKSDLEKTQINYVECESGTYANEQKQDDVTRIRNCNIIPIIGYKTAIIPNGYEAYILRFDSTKTFIDAYPFWVTGSVEISSVITGSTKYINLIIRDISAPEQDISDEVSTVSDGLKLYSFVDDSLSISGLPADAKVTGEAISVLRNDLKQTQTSYIKCESGTYAGSQKQDNPNRIRNIIPISVQNYRTIIIPEGYEAYIIRLDNNKDFINAYSFWVSGVNYIVSITTSETKYINLIIRKIGAEDQDISTYIDSVSDGLILNLIIDEVDALQSEMEEVHGEVSANVTKLHKTLPLCITSEGLFVNIEDGADDVPMESVVLSVDPSASGIVPNVYRTGKNILPLTVNNIKSRNTAVSWNGNSYTYNGITYTIIVNDLGSVEGVEVNGTASADSALFLISLMDYLTDGASYILSGCPEGGSLSSYSLRWVTSDFSNASSDIGTGTTLVYDADWTRVYIDIKSGTTINKVFRPMIRYANDKNNVFEAYNGVAYAVPLPDGMSAFYSGKVDAVKGKAVSSYKVVDLGTLNWVYESTGTYKRFYALTLQGDIVPPANNDTKADIFCDGYTTDAINTIFGSGTDLVVACSSTGAVSISDNRYNSASAFISAVTGKVLVYKANSDVEYSFDPISITTIRGVNNIWSNADSIKIEYRADNQLYIKTDHYDFAERYKNYEETAVAEYLKVGLPILELAGDVTGISKDNEVTLNCHFKNYEGMCTLKWQGSSSLAYQKKNYTIKFASKITVNEDWGNQKKYVLKANYIDPTHARNVVACKLWGQIVKSRSIENPALSGLVNGGAIDGFPVMVVMNGKFHGIYTFNIPKDEWMFGMTGSVEHEGILGAEDHTQPTQFKATVTEADLEAETSFSVEYAPNDSDIAWMATSVSQAISAVMNATGAGDKSAIEQYIDLDSAIDYYIFICLILGIDCTDKNYLLVTFDGTKWAFSAYDLDSIFGIHWAGGSYLSSDYTPTFASYASLHQLMGWIYNYDTAALKARYAELRSGVLSVKNVTKMFYNFGVLIPKPVKDMEYKRWNLIPASDTSDISQIVNWYKERVEILDAEIDALN